MSDDEGRNETKPTKKEKENKSKDRVKTVGRVLLVPVIRELLREVGLDISEVFADDEVEVEQEENDR